jgi:hypothetical protein
MLDSSQGRNQIELISVLIQYLPQPLHHWPNKANQHISVLINLTQIAVLTLHITAATKGYYKHQIGIPHHSSQPNISTTIMHTLLGKPQELDEKIPASY